jgi:hypothetical protein
MCIGRMSPQARDLDPKDRARRDLFPGDGHPKPCPLGPAPAAVATGLVDALVALTARPSASGRCDRGGPGGPVGGGRSDRSTGRSGRAGAGVRMRSRRGPHRAGCGALGRAGERGRRRGFVTPAAAGRTAAERGQEAPSGRLQIRSREESSNGRGDRDRRRSTLNSSGAMGLSSVCVTLESRCMRSRPPRRSPVGRCLPPAGRSADLPSRREARSGEG